MQVSSAKSLGVYINKYLNWECHIQNIRKKNCFSFGAIKRTRHLIPFNILMNVYNSLAQPHFDYCNVIWVKCGIGLFESCRSSKIAQLVF